MLYRQPRDSSHAREPIAFASPMMIFTPQGLVLGAGTILAPANGARKLKSLKGREQDVLALLSAAYGRAVAPSVLNNIERAAKSWSEGDDFTAHIHLAHSGLRALDDLPSAAHRLRMAKGVLDHGGSPRSVFEALRLDPRYITRWKNTTIPNSLVCPPDIPAVASGQARIVRRGKCPRPSFVRCNAGRPWEGWRSRCGQRTAEARHRSQPGPAARASAGGPQGWAGVQHVTLLGFYQSRGTMAWQGRLEAARTRRHSGRHRRNGRGPGWGLSFGSGGCLLGL